MQKTRKQPGLFDKGRKRTPKADLAKSRKTGVVKVDGYSRKWPKKPKK